MFTISSTEPISVEAEFEVVAQESGGQEKDTNSRLRRETNLLICIMFINTWLLSSYKQHIQLENTRKTSKNQFHIMKIVLADIKAEAAHVQYGRKGRPHLHQSFSFKADHTSVKSCQMHLTNSVLIILIMLISYPDPYTVYTSIN